MRNILLIIPFMLVVGYLLEIFFVLWKGRRMGDKWAGTGVRLKCAETVT